MTPEHNPTRRLTAAELDAAMARAHVRPASRNRRIDFWLDMATAGSVAVLVGFAVSVIISGVTF